MLASFWIANIVLIWNHRLTFYIHPNNRLTARINTTLDFPGTAIDYPGFTGEAEVEIILQEEEILIRPEH